MNRVEAVSVCVGYSDFLAAVAPWNIPHLARWVVVTAASDTQTREVCRRHSIDVVLSEEHTRGGEFAKGRMVELGLRQLSSDCWHLHLDADVALPARFGHLLEAAWLREDTLYGCDRVMVRSWADWQRLLASGWMATCHDYHCRLNFPEGFGLGSRWCDLRAGYVPIGFFQLAHASQVEYGGSRQRPYPTRHNSACRTDVQYGLLWDRRKRELLPELLVAHLESEPCKMGANWKGRTTVPFGPPGKAKAAAGREFS